MSDLLSTAENLPEKPSRSKLEQYADAIAVLRRKKRYSYQQIADFLLTEAKLEVDASTIWDFVQAQKKHGRQERKNSAPVVSGMTHLLSAIPPTVQEAPVAPPDPLPLATEQPRIKQKRAVYVPRVKQSAIFDPFALRTNDQVDDDS